MFDMPIDQELKNGMKFQAKYIAIVVRNAMEGFHSKYLSEHWNGLPTGKKVKNTTAFRRGLNGSTIRLSYRPSQEVKRPA